ncbi:MAG: DUF1266 domain-containing protein [Mycobacteriaceae bacterium]|uniref:DUF1266 domain-containing protein n=1 Tax=Corynebacterium sp. TaxID=1720 RepID=UPI003F94A3C8
MTHAVEFTAPTYESRLHHTTASSSAPRLLWSGSPEPTSPDADLQRAWSLTLPHELTDGRIVDAPTTPHPPNEGFRRLFAVDPGEVHRHALTAVYGVKDGPAALAVAERRLRDAGDPDYRELRPLLRTVLESPAPERPSSTRTLSGIDPRQHHVVVPFLQQNAPFALPTDPAELPVDTVAWDVSLAMRVLWLAHGGGLVTGEECSELALSALEQVRETYDGWHAFASGLVVGRAVSMGQIDDSSISYVDDVALALNHPDSPWSRLPLQG